MPDQERHASRGGSNWQLCETIQRGGLERDPSAVTCPRCIAIMNGEVERPLRPWSQGYYRDLTSDAQPRSPALTSALMHEFSQTRDSWAASLSDDGEKPRPRRNAQLAHATPRPTDYALLEPLRNAVAAIKDTTLAGEVRAAVADRVRHLQCEHNRGEPFPVRKGDLPRGRPRGPKKDR